MKNIKLLGVLSINVFLLPAFVSPQQNSPHAEGGYAPQQKKFALVIGNGLYTGSLGRLANPQNDADDIAAVLSHLGFSVDKILNGTLHEMEQAVLRLRERLRADTNSYGFFFYAGHGVQSSGENFLIPVDADIPGENYLRNRAVSVQAVLDDLNDAHNSLNVVVLDACRDNPYRWSRGGSRGLAMVNRQPTDSIIVYATSAGQQAADGEGRNGLFTSQLLPNLATPGIDVKEVFNRTGQDVARTSGNRQIPAIYSQFFGTAYFGEASNNLEANPAGRPQIIIGGGAREESPGSPRYRTLGVSAGSSFAAPWMIGTLRGTIAPLDNWFVELGFDYGMVSRESGVNSYSCLYPYAHMGYFWPFSGKGGMYAGIGGGVWMVSYKFSDGEYSENFFLAALTAGINLFDMIDISYTCRTNFTNVSHKVSVGYTYRFW